MKTIKYFIILLSLFLSISPKAAIYYVGDTGNTNAQCDESNHLPSLGGAILAAAFNGTEPDEIRLTNTVSYLGSVQGSTGSYSLTGWNSTDNGELTIIGGYTNCNSQNSSGQTEIGNDSSSIFSIGSQSTVTLKNLAIQNSERYGVVLTSDSLLFLESVTISNNAYNGIYVTNASAVFIDADSLISFNGFDFPNTGGGGVRCEGVSSAVYLSGRLSANYGLEGGNLNLSDGCYGQLEGGSRISSLLEEGTLFGGGIYVGNEARLFSLGGNERVVISSHYALNGGAIYVAGSGKVTLNNTLITRNKASQGSAIYAINGGSIDLQVEIDRREVCSLLTNCSEFEENVIVDNLIHVQNSRVRINRTIFDKNTYDENTIPTDIRSLIEVRNNSTLEMSHSNFISNEIQFLIRNEGKSELSHITAVDNTYPAEIIGDEFSFIWASENGDLRMENSIFQNTQGGFNAPNTFPTISGKCNLINNSSNWPDGSYTIGSAIFNSVAGGDARQQPNSDGVDMCREDSFNWSENIDIEFQNSPVDEATNPQANPGEFNGFFDAGFDEVYANIVDDLIFENGFD